MHMVVLALRGPLFIFKCNWKFMITYLIFLVVVRIDSLEDSMRDISHDFGITIH